MSCSSSDEGDGGSPRPGRPPELGMGQDQGKPPDCVRRQLLEIEVLNDEDPVVDVEDLRDPEGPLRILGRNRAVAPRIAAGQSDAALSQPIRQFTTRSRLARTVD